MNDEPGLTWSFPDKLRLSKASEFRAVFDLGSCKVSCRHLLIIALRNQLEIPRIGLVVGKKRIARAVHRNRVKRIIRDSFRRRQYQLTGFDIVVLVRGDLTRTENPQIHEMLQSLWVDLEIRIGKLDPVDPVIVL